MWFRTMFVSFILNIQQQPYVRMYSLWVNKQDDQLISSAPIPIPKINDTLPGYDGRFPMKENCSSQVILDLHSFYGKMRLLNYLESPKHSEQNKIAAIEEYNRNVTKSKYVMNIKSGFFQDEDTLVFLNHGKKRNE
jgi:hypothetical protein